jgi:hypothetical protein
MVGWERAKAKGRGRWSSWGNLNSRSLREGFGAASVAPSDGPAQVRLFLFFFFFFSAFFTVSFFLFF